MPLTDRESEADQREASVRERGAERPLSDSGEGFRGHCSVTSAISIAVVSRAVFTTAQQEEGMLVLQGQHTSLEADQAASESLVEHTAATGEPALRVWSPPRHVAFGRRDASSDGYDEAVSAAESQDFAAVEREVGGRAVAVTDGILAFAYTESVEGDRRGIQVRYDRVLDRLQTAFGALGVETEPGEPPDSFCPGSHSLQADGKVAGLAQRVTSDVARVGGVLVVKNPAVIANVLDPVYAALGVPFDPESVGSVADAGGPSDPTTVAPVVEGALVAGRETTTRNVRNT
ncbi:lipoyl protein ligase domain-containing protein [Halobacteriales archaeon Cl-PHB]